jgi:hypothetical protein
MQWAEIGKRMGKSADQHASPAMPRVAGAGSSKVQFGQSVEALCIAINITSTHELTAEL